MAGDARKRKRDDAEEFVYDAAGELIVIGAALADAEVCRKLVHRLSADEFLAKHHGVIWRALRKVSDARLEPTGEVLRRFVLDAGGADDAVDHLLAVSPNVPKNLDWHVETLAWDATRARVLTGQASELVLKLRDPTAERTDIVTAARSVARALGDSGGRRHMRRPGEVYREYRAELAARRVSRNVYPLGELAFDSNLTEGFAPGRMTVSAGLPGAGKSTVWVALAIKLAMRGRRPLYCAWEMPVESVLDVAVSNLTGIELKRIVQGDLTDIDIERLDGATKWVLKKIKFMGNPFFDRARSGAKPSNDANLDILEGHLAESGCDVVVYDLWERMLHFRRPDDVSAALYRLQDLHVEYGIHGVVINQLLLKDVEKRMDKRPTREAIKGSGAYVEVADLIFGIHRDGQFKNVPDNKLEMICLKQRKGVANWAVAWDWDGSRCSISAPLQVSYDPGLESSGGDFGVDDITSIATRRNRRRE